MLVIESVLLLRQHTRRLHREGKRIALVLTTGNLHDGRVKLVDEAKTNAGVVMVSIFANPMRFDRADDLVRYPRVLQDDYEKLDKCHVDLVFAPMPAGVYPQGTEGQTYVDAFGLSTMLEGVSRPDHFRGVSTTASKLLNLVQPDVACFGERDFQQLALVRKVVADMGYSTEVIGVPVVRAEGGLALSSRNGYLITDQRKTAPGLYKVLSVVVEKLTTGDRQLDGIIAIAEQELDERGFRADDIQTHNADILLEPTDASQCAMILMATWLGQACLIDSQIITLGRQTAGKNRAILAQAPPRADGLSALLHQD